MSWSIAPSQKGSSAINYALFYEGGGITYRLWNTSGASVQIQATSQVPLNAWSHVAATFDGTTLRLYVNGTPYATTASFSGVLRSSTDALFIGNRSSVDRNLGWRSG